MADLPTPAEIDWLAHVMARRMLADAASEGRHDQLLSALRAWLPADQITDAQLGAVAHVVQKQWRLLAGAVQVRLENRQNREIAKPLRGCEGRI